MDIMWIYCLRFAHSYEHLHNYKVFDLINTPLFVFLLYEKIYSYDVTFEICERKRIYLDQA